MTEQQAALTRGFAKGLGIFLILFGLGIAVRGDILFMLVPAFMQDGPLVFVTAVFGLGIGCAMVAAHHHFNSLAALLITVFGWITLIRSAILLFAPQIVSQVASVAMRIPGIPLIPAAIAVLIGIYLTYVGWFAARKGTP
ncbi:MAG: hypothetical protein WAU68_01290 [Vitreimonas sp.]